MSIYVCWNDSYLFQQMHEKIKQCQSYLFLDFWLSPLMQNNQRYNAYLSLYYLLTLNFMICMKFFFSFRNPMTICLDTIFWDFPKFIWYKTIFSWWLFVFNNTIIITFNIYTFSSIIYTLQHVTIMCDYLQLRQRMCWIAEKYSSLCMTSSFCLSTNMNETKKIWMNVSFSEKKYLHKAICLGAS